MSDIIKTQHSLAIKAQHQPEHQFDHLYRLICREDWIRTALTAVLKNTGAKTAGIDGITKEALATEAAQALFVQELRLELQNQEFRPLPVRRVYISDRYSTSRPSYFRTGVARQC
jgi:retron-type reverse transcriptase